MIWLKKIKDKYLDWKLGKVVFTQEEVGEMLAVFNYLLPNYFINEKITFSLNGNNYAGKIVSFTFLDGEKRFAVETETQRFGVNQVFLISENQITGRV